MYRKNTAGQFIVVQLILTATGAVGTGLSPAARRCLDGTFAAGGGTYTEDGTTGSYKYALAQADTNANNCSIITTATGCIPVVVNFVTTAADPTDSVRFGLTALPNAAAEAAGGLYTRGAGAGQIAQQANGQADVNLSTIKTQTVTCAAGVTVLASVGTAATSTAQTGDNFARLGAPAGASVSADIAAVKVDTAAVKVQTDKLTFTVANQIDANVLDWKSATAPAMTGDAFARLGAPAGASVSADVAAVKVDTAAVKVQTDKMTFTVPNVIDANMLRTNGDATAAANVAKTTRAICRGTITTGTSATSFAATGITPASAVNDQFKGRIVTFDADTTTVALRGQATDITAYTHATATFTVTALTSTPAVGDTFSVT